MKENVFLVVGLGTFGWETCEELSRKGAKVIAVDNRSEKIERIKDIVTQAILLDSTDEENLSNLPIEDVDLAVIAIGDNIEANILTTALLKKAGIPYIISRATTDIHQQVLRQVGANEIINIEKDAGVQLAEKIIAPGVLDRIPITREMSVAELYSPKAFAGKTLLEIDLTKKMELTIIVIKRSILSVDEEGNPVMSEQIIFPDGTKTLEDGDILLIAGRNSNIEKLKAM